MTDLRKARRAAGITQSGIAKALNVSRATVQRFEYGTSKNAKVEKFYKNLQKNTDLASEFKSLRDESIRRYKELEKAGLDNIYVARRLVKDTGVPTGYVLGEDRATAKRAIGKLKEFIESQTSTVEGYETWKANVDYASKRTSGSESYSINEKFWKLYNEIKEDSSISKYLKSNGDYDSDQLIYDLWYEKIKLQQSGGRWNARKIKEAIKTYKEGEL